MGGTEHNTSGAFVICSAELIDAGLGFDPPREPQISGFPSPSYLGGGLLVAGSQFQGIFQGSGGNTRDSPADYPLVQLRALENGRTVWLPQPSDSTWLVPSFTSVPVSEFSAGYAFVTVFVNGITAYRPRRKSLTSPSPAWRLSL